MCAPPMAPFLRSAKHFRKCTVDTYSFAEYFGPASSSSSLLLLSSFVSAVQVIFGYSISVHFQM